MLDSLMVMLVTCLLPTAFCHNTSYEILFFLLAKSFSSTTRCTRLFDTSCFFAISSYVYNGLPEPGNLSSDKSSFVNRKRTAKLCNAVPQNITYKSYTIVCYNIIIYKIHKIMKKKEKLCNSFLFV